MPIKKLKKKLQERKIRKLWKSINKKINSNPSYVSFLEKLMKEEIEKQTTFK